MCLLSFLKWGSIRYSLGIVQWDFTRRDHPGNPGGGIRVESCQLGIRTRFLNSLGLYIAVQLIQCFVYLPNLMLEIDSISFILLNNSSS